MSWSVAQPSDYESAPIKGSRFIATVAPIHTADDVQDVLARVRERFPRASHHCWAFVLSDGTTRSSDDGEPSGSAGRPILARIEGRQATDILVVVTRWFGGTKLGVGGLVRAYGGCAGEALDAADPIEVEVRVDRVIRYDYADTGSVEAVVNELSAETIAADYGSDVRRTLRLDPRLADTLAERLSEATGGRARLEDA
jgi:uncharacterized YigZ family protein